VPGYEITGELGRGGMGIVYRAFDEKRGATVALKALKRADPSAIFRFKHEFRSLADVSHPNLVTLHELTADGPNWFFTMELVEGVDFLSFVRWGTDRPASVLETKVYLGSPSPPSPGTLGLAHDVVGDTESFDPKRVCEGHGVPPHRGSSLSPAVVARLRIALLQLAEGIAVLHESGKLHRDLKPSNVLVTRQGRLVILDFGIAADLGASGVHQSLLPYVLGTSAYMAPEQAAGLPVSPASDWYSLGSMLYEVLTGNTPFLGRTHEVLIEKQRFEPPAPSELAPGLPDDLCALCVDLLRRDPEARPTGRDVLRRLGNETGQPRLPIPLPPSPRQLEPADAEGLALTLLVSEDQAACAHAVAIARESRGNPFFLTELVRYVQADTGLLHRMPGANELAFDEVLWARIRRLPDEARRLLELVAVSGRPLCQADASRAALLGASEQKALLILRSGRLLRSIGPEERDEIETYHDRVREAVVAHIPPTALEGHHRSLAMVLESSGRADPEVLAVHFQGAREHTRPGMHFGDAAAQAAEALAFDRAAKLYRLALEMGPGADALARRLRVGLADALANAGGGPEAAREYLAAVAGATVAETLDRRRRAATQYLISGHIDEGITELTTVLKAVGMAPPKNPRRAVLSLILHRLKIRLRGLHFHPRDASQVSPDDLTRIDVCWAAASGLGIVEPVRGAEFQARGLLLALRAGEPYRIARALVYEASHVSSAGGPSQRRVARLAQAAEKIAQQLDDPYLLGGIFVAHGVAAYMSGLWKQAGELLDRAAAIHRTQCTGATFEVDSSTTFSLWSLQFRGELAELSRRWPVVLKEALERGDRHMLTNLNTFLMSTLRLAVDDPDGAEDTLRPTLDHLTRQGFQVQHNEWFGAEVQIRLCRGDAIGAWNFLETRYRPSLARSHLMRVQKIKVFFYERRARCALAAAFGAAKAGPLLHAAERDARRLEREGMAWSRALSIPIRAGVASARGDRSRAATLFAKAVQQLEAVDMNLYAAASRRRLGQILGGEEGRAQLERADCWMNQQGIRNPARMTDVFAPLVT
jgi:serine/threonine protein kinase